MCYSYKLILFKLFFSNFLTGQDKNTDSEHIYLLTMYGSYNGGLSKRVLNLPQTIQLLPTEGHK